MGRALLRRLGFAVVVVAAVSLITFCILALAPGDPARLLAGPQASPADIEKLRVALGLDQPLWRQYLAYAGRVLEGDFGTSVVTGRPVAVEIFSRAAATIELMMCAMLVAIGAGGALGVWAARNTGRWPDHLVRGLAVFGVSAPGFWIGMLLILIFYRDLGLLPSGGRGGPLDPTGPTGFLLVDGVLSGNVGLVGEALRHLALPVLALALGEAGGVARLVRAQLLGILEKDYMRMARAGGLSEGAAIWRHGLRNVAIPLIPVFALSLAQILSGSVVIETVFAWPGVGAYLVSSIFALDFPVILGFALLASVAYVFANLAADVAQAALDPRLRDGV